jgi:hypothetical protein
MAQTKRYIKRCINEKDFSNLVKSIKITRGKFDLITKLMQNKYQYKSSSIQTKNKGFLFQYTKLWTIYKNYIRNNQ